MRKLRNAVAVFVVVLSLLSGGMALAGPSGFDRAPNRPQNEGPSAQSDATQQVLEADEMFRLFGLQEPDEASFVTADGRVFIGDVEIPFQFPGSALLRANLSGENEIDEDGRRSAGDPNGRGTAQAELFLDPVELCVSLEVENIKLPAAAAHIHRGRAGENGPVVITLPTPGENGTAEGCPSEGVTAELLEEIADRPRRFYVNVHNATFPAGAVRGQLHQDPAAVIPSPGDRQFFRERLFELDDSDPQNPEPTGEQIGTVNAECSAVTAGEGFADFSWVCSRVFVLDGRGEISTSEAFTFADPLEDSLTVDGGSGEFDDAGGQIDFEVESIEGTPFVNSIYTVNLLHLED